MLTRTSNYRLDHPDLPAVLAEIIERLCDDDWERRSSDQDAYVYYTIGVTAQQIEASGQTDFTSTLPIPTANRPLTRWFVKAHVAGTQPDHESASRKRAREMGLTDAAIDAFLAGQLEELRDLDLANRPILLRALADCLEGAVLARRRRDADDISADERTEIAADRAKAYLREIGEKFRRLLKRIDTLDALDFADPQIEEASRCYLYGFWRGAVVLAAAAVETHLRRATGKSSFEKYKDLTGAAMWSGHLGKAWSDAADRLFRLRNQVVHEAHSPSREEVVDAIDWARGVVGKCLER